MQVVAWLDLSPAAKKGFRTLGCVGIPDYLRLFVSPEVLEGYMILLSSRCNVTALPKALSKPLAEHNSFCGGKRKDKTSEEGDSQAVTAGKS